jgi:hypothetical protein
MVQRLGYPMGTRIYPECGTAAARSAIWRRVWLQAKPFRCCRRPKQSWIKGNPRTIRRRIVCPPGFRASRRIRGESCRIPTHIYFLFEGNIHSYRQIFMDGRKHPADPDPTWYGHSIGSWDGDTLVVDTVGFNDKFWFDFRGHPHTEQLHTIERYTRKDLGTLENKVTIIDPGDYSKPFTLTFTARLRPKEELMEYICQENQQDSQHMKGSAGPPVNP